MPAAGAAADMNRFSPNIPRQVVRLGLACNEKCLFCKVPPDSGEAAGPAHTLRAIKAAGRGGRLSISGGEPTLCPQLARLIACAGKLGVDVELQTNGLRLAAAGEVEKLVSAGLRNAFVSLHSHIPLIHDFLTGVKGGHVKCVAAVRRLVANGVKVALNPVVTAANYRDLAGYVKFAAELGVQSISLSVVQPRGLALRNSALVPDYRKLRVPVRAALKAAAGAGIPVRNPICGLPLCVGGWHKYPDLCVEYSQGKLGLPFIEGKVKMPGCAKCAASAYCGGVWREYLVLRGAGALRPLRRGDLQA